MKQYIKLISCLLLVTTVACSSNTDSSQDNHNKGVNDLNKKNTQKTTNTSDVNYIHLSRINVYGYNKKVGKEQPYGMSVLNPKSNKTEFDKAENTFSLISSQESLKKTLSTDQFNQVTLWVLDYENDKGEIIKNVDYLSLVENNKSYVKQLVPPKPIYFEDRFGENESRQLIESIGKEGWTQFDEHFTN
ncbi:hypothetical protein J2Z69_001841 [Paenibacillus shirakamiensis]|uniref:Lipoprotein n=1 Tax=Paenibacillus shirakamiensis TaxID=1265935 RepID=A0ABS4JGH0_9BACL|nr:hypothetical protein [Paenibacillus shirakamiensis]MBP2000810.1 hypothetical protein [Paenibacillus shirakamiensis]